jgi:hypothetical protein
MYDAATNFDYAATGGDKTRHRDRIHRIDEVLWRVSEKVHEEDWRFREKFRRGAGGV